MISQWVVGRTFHSAGLLSSIWVTLLLNNPCVEIKHLSSLKLFSDFFSDIQRSATSGLYSCIYCGLLFIVKRHRPSRHARGILLGFTVPYFVNSLLDPKISSREVGTILWSCCLLFCLLKVPNIMCVSNQENKRHGDISIQSSSPSSIHCSIPITSPPSLTRSHSLFNRITKQSFLQHLVNGGQFGIE